MTTEKAKDEIAGAVAQRKTMLERQFFGGAREPAEIAKDIEACRSLLVKLKENPRQSHAMQ